MQSGLKMGNMLLDLNEPPNQDGFKCYVMLAKDQKAICRTQALNPPFEMPPSWNISDIVRKTRLNFLSELSHCFLRPAFQNCYEQREWGIFLRFLQTNDKVAIVKFKSYEFYILPPDEGSNFSHALVAYRMDKAHNAYNSRRHGTSVADKTLIMPSKLINSEASMYMDGTCRFAQPTPVSSNTCTNGRPMSSSRKPTVPSFCMGEDWADRSDAYMRKRSSAASVDNCFTDLKFTEEAEGRHACESGVETCIRPQLTAVKQDDLFKNNYVRADPTYLRTLGQAHSGWIFGAIAELVDNSRDAKATKMDISIENIYSKTAGKEIPMLSIIDDGHGMNHQEILRMISFGHKQPDGDDPDRIGRFGIGFKTGAMRLGRDALVLTQAANSRSIAFLSQSLNEGKDNLEIPIISYCRKGKFMEVDTSVQSEALAKYNLKAIKEFSPFNKYLIGEKAGLFCEKGTGTQIYIWNLDEWGSNYCLESQTGMTGGSSFHQGDILIHSRRIRSRPGQISQKVPLDYSLRSYLEVIFLDPRMKIYVQGSLVKSRPLAKSLNKTVVENGNVMGKLVQLTIGRCQLEWEQANCGIFLYWHGRLIEWTPFHQRFISLPNGQFDGPNGKLIIWETFLRNKNRCQVPTLLTTVKDLFCLHRCLLNKDVKLTVFPALEAYKRVGGMIHNADMGRGVIGVIDVTDLMNDGNGRVWVHSNKQGFQDCEPYARLEEWLGNRSDDYWDKNFDTLQLKKGTALYKPDHEWVQCDKCRKWRMLSSGFDSRTLPQEWFCYMKPFNGKCETPEQKVGRGVITLSAKRSGYGPHDKPVWVSTAEGDSDDDSSQTVEEDVEPPVLKRLRRGPSRACKKAG